MKVTWFDNHMIKDVLGTRVYTPEDGQGVITGLDDSYRDDGAGIEVLLDDATTHQPFMKFSSYKPSDLMLVEG